MTQEEAIVKEILAKIERTNAETELFKAQAELVKRQAIVTK